MSFRRLILGGAIVTALAGCGASAARTAPSTTTQAAGPQVVVTRDAGEAPKRCTAAAVARRLVGYAHDLSNGRAAAAAAAFAPEPAFQWYSAYAHPARGDDPGGQLIRDRGRLAASFRGRVAEHERLTLREVAVNYYPTKGEADFNYSARRSADDLPRGGQAVAAKGAVDCSTGRIVVVSLGPERSLHLCPAAPKGAVAACTGRR